MRSPLATAPPQEREEPSGKEPRRASAPDTRAILLRALTLDTAIPAQRTGEDDVPAPRAERALTPAAAFDALYVYAAPGLIRQAHVLTGSRRLAFESVEYAFRRAWERWPEVARDTDPVGWVRAESHTYALSPWHRLRRLPGRPLPAPEDPVVRALLTLSPRQRRAVLLCDGLGLSPSETAAETEAGTAATNGRLRNARAALDAFGAPDLAALLDEESARTVAQPWSVRESTERRAVALTRTVWAVLAAFSALVAVVIVVTS
ncbi:sigma factor-like helix-turn-helix DNA-binding protein [Streptomyces sp. NPDC050145]|uniref:sigma factor-like helix-turn-helix DNA-binding protein n=1 Tax=Streptomyces sp. NPDC050145 TaxID=3365602 RepID=UPI0037BDF3DA